eukprot:TRINITY_DN5523_c0_g1_i4.p1 TRINITY_DN5523_c0_g1~~TRINITY_DN5523_c0_g1_i4.p1  ORF type:complete len:108 (-),score=34.81 TRINITY_DN5523_c0_g1_i4:60-383(-)
MSEERESKVKSTERKSISTRNCEEGPKDNAFLICRNYTKVIERENDGPPKESVIEEFERIPKPANYDELRRGPSLSEMVKGFLPFQVLRLFSSDEDRKTMDLSLIHI